NPLNELRELSDGSNCFVTKLWPITSDGEVTIADHESKRQIRFYSLTGIETRILPGIGNQAFRFDRASGRLQLERLPVICISVPTSYGNRTESAVRNKIEVIVSDEQNHQACGAWQKHSSTGDGEQDFFLWRWNEQLLSRGLIGNQTIRVHSPVLGLKVNHVFDLLPCKSPLERCWGNLPGDYLLWFLLCQSPNGITRNEISVLRDIIEPDAEKNEDWLDFLLSKYKQFGLLAKQKGFWYIAESRARLLNNSLSCVTSFC